MELTRKQLKLIEKIRKTQEGYFDFAEDKEHLAELDRGLMINLVSTLGEGSILAMIKALELSEAGKQAT